MPLKWYSDNGGNHTVENPFCFIPISRSVPEIQGFKVSIAFKRRDYERVSRPSDPHFFPGNGCCFQESRLSLVWTLG